MLSEMMTNLAQGVFVAFLAERLTEYLLGYPLEKLAPELDREWLRYVVLIAGGASSYVAELNMLPIFDPYTGRIATALVVGCGPEFIHRLVKEAKPLEEFLDTFSSANVEYQPAMDEQLEYGVGSDQGKHGGDFSRER